MEILFFFFLLLAFPIAAIIGLLPAFIAWNKGQSFIWWWIYGALLFIVALPHALIMEGKIVPTGQTRYGTNVTQIFIRENGQQQGPYPVGYVRAWLDSGRLDQNALAWHEGCPDWIPVSSMFDVDRMHR